MSLVVWDFDGVLNANIVDGRFVWADRLWEDWQIDKAALAAHLFHPSSIGRIMRGEVDLLDALTDWLREIGHDADPADVLTYWFTRDALPDAEVTRHLSRADLRHVIGTNNERRRAAFIETEMGFGARVEHVFASGRIGLAKPEPAYFAHIEGWSGLPPEAHVLIDDTKPNVDAATARGWRAFYFTDQTCDGLDQFLDQLT